MHVTHATNNAVPRKSYNICAVCQGTIVGLVIGARKDPGALIPCKIHVRCPELEILVYYDQSWCPILLLQEALCKRH